MIPWPSISLRSTGILLIFATDFRSTRSKSIWQRLTFSSSLTGKFMDILCLERLFWMKSPLPTEFISKRFIWWRERSWEWSEKSITKHILAMRKYLRTVLWEIISVLKWILSLMIWLSRNSQNAEVTYFSSSRTSRKPEDFWRKNNFWKNTVWGTSNITTRKTDSFFPKAPWTTWLKSCHSNLKICTHDSKTMTLLHFGVTLSLSTTFWLLTLLNCYLRYRSRRKVCLIKTRR